MDSLRGPHGRENDMTKKMGRSMRAVLVTTDKKGVFFGYTDEDGTAGTITLERARMVIYWSAETRGVLGLAATGPAMGSRVTPAIPKLVLQGVQAVADCTEKAVAAMEMAPWN